MAEDLAAFLEQTIARELPGLRAITDEAAGVQPEPGKWSHKEELGHLIDSATNNHVRFVRAAVNGEFRGPGYDQNGWVSAHPYQEMPWTELIDFWSRYNRLLAGIVRRVPESALENQCFIADAPPVTLRFVIRDYVLHMQHHLDHILDRAEITRYPGAELGV